MFYITINGSVVRTNIKSMKKRPPIRIATKKNDKSPIYAFEVKTGPAKLIYSPDQPIMGCGARLVLETEEVEVIK